ncbi:hypothetical protein ACWELV_12975 [Streptomyces mirabilis]
MAVRSPARGDGRPCAHGERGGLEARFSGAVLAWDTVEAAEQGRSAELTSRYEANGILTAARDAIVLDLIREGGNRTGEAIVGLVFRRTREPPRSVNSATFRATGHPVVEPARLVYELSTAQQQIVSTAWDSPTLYGSSWWPNSPPRSTQTGEAVTLMSGGIAEYVSPDRTTPRRTAA